MLPPQLQILVGQAYCLHTISLYLHAGPDSIDAFRITTASWGMRWQRSLIFEYGNGLIPDCYVVHVATGLPRL